MTLCQIAIIKKRKGEIILFDFIMIQIIIIFIVIFIALHTITHPLSHLFLVYSSYIDFIFSTTFSYFLQSPTSIPSFFIHNFLHSFLFIFLIVFLLSISSILSYNILPHSLYSPTSYSSFSLSLLFILYILLTFSEDTLLHSLLLSTSSLLHTIPFSLPYSLRYPNPSLSLSNTWH